MEVEELKHLAIKVLQDIDYDIYPINESTVEIIIKHLLKHPNLDKLTHEELYCNLHYDVWVGEKYKHYNGNVYTVIHLANLKETDDYKTTVVYQGDNGLVWTRPIKDWNRSFTNLEDYGQK